MNPTLLHTLAPGEFATLLERLLAIADDAVVVTDAQQRIVAFNDGAERTFGWPRDRILGQPLDLLLPEAHRPGHSALMRDFGLSPCAARRMGDKREVHGRRADGTVFDAEASISHVDFDGRVFYTAILRDVSEQRQAARALALSEARFRGLAEAAPVGIFQTDLNGGCLYVNDRWCRIAGMSPDEALGVGWLRALHPAERSRVQQAWNECVGQGTAFAQHYRFLRPDGSETWVMGSAVPSRDGDGRVDGYIGTVTDVTESHHQSLALERAKSEAEAAARAKSLFLANMSHEIRTPLNAVIGMTTLLLDTPLSEDQRDFARTIRGSGETLLEIINDILDYSKADVGKLEIEQRSFDLRRCIEESLDLVLPRALEKNLNLAYLIEDDTPESLIGDATRVRQILVNLLSNAVKFTHQGEVFVAVESRPAGDETIRLRLSVQDTGIGIAAEDLPRLFQSFTQVDASTTRKYGGTGLGLAICKRLAELMGGSVGVESEPGRGSTFHVWIEVRVAAATAQVDFLQRNAPALAGKRILIVDDNLTNRRIVTRLALLWGMVPSTLPSALEALDRIRHGEPFDLAVLDMSMPGIDGIDLATEIRRRRSAEELPLVMLTSLGQRQALQAAQAGVLAACLSKPIKPGLLFSTLVAVLEGRCLVDALPAEPPSPVPDRVLRVLVAEDNVINQRVALRLLQHLGYRADLAANGRDAIRAVAAQAYDVVLMDIHMPEVDGLDAARAIVRQRGEGGLPRLIAMTANAMPGDRESYIEAGMDGYLAKPIELAELADALLRVSAPPARPGAVGPVRRRGDQVLDHARLEHLRGLQDESQPSLVRELIDMFLQDSPGHVLRLAESVNLADFDGLRRHSHRFLSATQNIGAARLSALCMELEKLARQGELGAAPALVLEVSAERDRVHEALAATRLRY